MTLKQLIDAKKFDYVNSNITEENFPVPTTPLRTDYKLYHFDRYISSEDAIKEMEKDGYAPATIYELLNWDGWNDEDWVIALGSVAGVGGDRRVAYLGRGDSERNLHLHWFGSDWIRDFRFLAVRNTVNLKSKNSELGTSESLSLAIETVKKAGYQVSKIM